jgi:hypothetical protein
MKINEYYDSITPNKERISEKMREKQTEMGIIAKNADVVAPSKWSFVRRAAAVAACLAVIATFVIVVVVDNSGREGTNLTGVGTSETSENTVTEPIVTTTNVATAVTTTVLTTSEPIVTTKFTSPYVKNEMKRIPLIMQPYSVIIYDENGNPLIEQGGELSEEEFQKLVDMFGDSVKLFQTEEDNLNEDTLIVPNTKVEYSMQGDIQNIYYLVPGTKDQYTLSPPSAKATITRETLVPILVKKEDRPSGSYDTFTPTDEMPEGIMSYETAAEKMLDLYEKTIINPYDSLNFNFNKYERVDFKIFLGYSETFDSYGWTGMLVGKENGGILYSCTLDATTGKIYRTRAEEDISETAQPEELTEEYYIESAIQSLTDNIYNQSPVVGSKVLDREPVNYNYGVILEVDFEDGTKYQVDIKYGADSITDFSFILR